MPPGPGLSHRKSRLGCQQCKARKVKCDEAKPRCAACVRHGVECVYAPPPAQASRREHAPDAGNSAHITSILDDTPPSNAAADYPTPASSSGGYSSLELRMLHWFVAKTSESLSASRNLWKIRAPLVAFDCPPVFDVLIALATLHVIREKQYVAPASATKAWGQFMGGDSYFDRQSIDELRTISEHYFQRGVQSHTVAVMEMSTLKDNEGLFVGAILIAIYALFMLADVETASADYNETVWFKLSIGPREIGSNWMNAAGSQVIAQLASEDNESNVMDDPELQNPAHAQVLRPLAELGRDFERISPEDDAVYEEVLIYIGLMYHMAFTQSESPRATCRRLFALPSRLPTRFRDMVFEQRPRALALLLVAFAIGKLIEDDAILLKGVARNQIPAIHDRLPNAWKALLRWPLDVLQTDTSDPRAWPPIHFGI